MSPPSPVTLQSWSWNLPKKPIFDPEETYRRSTTSKALFLGVGTAAIAIAAVFATTLGAAHLSVGEVFRAVVARLLPSAGVKTSWLAQAVVWGLRMPRILMAVVGGAGLALAGAVLQGTLRNPLASPFTLGISGGAAFGAALAIILGAGFAGAGKYLVITNAFVFSLLAAFLVYGLSALRGITSEALILAGVAMNFLFMALTSLLQYFGNSEEVKAVVFWLMGSLHTASWSNLLPMTVVFFICFPILIRRAWDLNTLAAGDEIARSLGTNVERVRVGAMLTSVLLTASIICFTGVIGFVSLLAPHIARMIVGPDHRFLLPASAVVGALVLLAADSLARTAVAPIEIPVGIVTSFLGIPLFIYLLLRKKQVYWRGG